jgi:monovalent cation:H+ antiporter, CPA1 family
MLALPNILLTIAGLLVLVGMLQPVASRLNISHSVLLAVVGIWIGAGAGYVLAHDLPHVFGAAAALLVDFPINSNVFLYIFLPILLFEAALAIDVRRMAADAAPILVLAVVAVVVTTAVVGLALWPVAGVPLVACLLLGAIVATTDPGAVIAIFRDLGAPARLTRLVEGESLLNDAAAIALFTVLLTLLITGRETGVLETVTIFVWVFAGGAVVGYVGGRVLMWLVPRLRDSGPAEATLTLALPYIVYVLSETYLGVSGVVAVVAAGLTVSGLGVSRFSPDNRAFLHDLWRQIAFWAGSLVFILAAMLVPRLMLGATAHDLLLIGLVAVAALLARAMVLFGLLPLLSAARLAQRVSHRYKAVILWGGLRGAVTLALALAVTENRALVPELQRFVAIVATGYVLVTLLLNGTTLRLVMHLLRLDRLSPLDQALRHQVLALALANVRDSIRQTAESHRIGPRPTADVVEPYEKRIEEANARREIEAEVADRDRITLGLVAVAVRERELILEHFRHRSVSRGILERMLAGVERIVDGARTGGRIGYNRAARRQIAYGLGFRLAHWLHRHARIDRFLVARLADRFELLLVGRMVLEELRAFVPGKLAPVLGGRVSELIGEIITQRHEQTARALDALRLQYPAYADALERRFLRRTALRLEADEYRLLYEEGLIGQELHNDLRREVQARRAATARRPRLDLGLHTRELVDHFSLFTGLTTRQLDKVSARLRSRFALPGEKLIRRGDRGAEMYFISSGAVEVAVGRRRIRLGRGDVFGELALLANRPRQADVTALGYCQLLVLHIDDFRMLVATEPEIRARIDRIAAERIAMNRELLRAG